MNHNVKLDLGEAAARLETFRKMSLLRAASGPAYNPALLASQNLAQLALEALHPSATMAVFYAYKPVFLDLMARWVENPALYEDLYTKKHAQPLASVIIAAMSRVFTLFPESAQLIETHLSRTPWDALDQALLALYRIYSSKPRRFARFVSPEKLHAVLTLPDRSVAKFLAIKILCIYLNASETSRDEMLNTHIKGSLVAPYDGGADIDYRFVDLVDAKRLSNHTKLPAAVPFTSQILELSRSELSGLVVSICGVLVTANPPKDPLDKAVPTENAVHVLQRLAHMVKNNKPIMLHGHAGSGKTFLITQFAKYLSMQDDIVKIHLGEQTDAKLLLGTYTSGEKPGSFEWRSGVLTTAVKEGKWVLVEDIDKAPTEVLSILLTLLEKRVLSIPSRGETIEAHSGFNLISTVRTRGDTSSQVPDMIGLRLWEQIEVKTPNEMELRAILAARYPLIMNWIAKFITVYDKVRQIYSTTAFISLNKGSHPRVISTRDLMKFCSRCDKLLRHKGITSSSNLIEAETYEHIFAEAVACFGSAITEHDALAPLVGAIGEILEMPASRINLFLEAYVPSFYADDEKLEIGRAVLHKSSLDQALFARKKSKGVDANFARTKHSKRLMEQIGVGIEMLEPILLVGETGTGKTTVVQEIAKMMNKKLTVINVSQQTESGDLLGGYKPVNTKSVAVPLQETFENLFLATFSQKKNARFSALLSKCFNRNQWKNVVKLWKEAVKMAREILTKSEDSDDDEGGPKKKRRLGFKEKSALFDKWLEFDTAVGNFEVQASNLDNAFVFSYVEGSLVKAVRNGDWLLLDEINLASPDTLESIADLLSEDPDQRSILLSERGDIEATRAHPEFRIFGCMNPSTDVGKKDLPLSIRSRFNEIYVHSPDRDREDLISIIAKYIERYTVGDDWVIEDIAELYYEAKALSDSNKIVDGANQKPHFSIRTLTRTLIYVRDIVSIYGLRRALFEGFCMSFLTLLDRKSEDLLKPIIAKYTVEKLKNAKQVLSRCPPAPTAEGVDFIQFKHYWMKRGPGEITSPNYIITPFVEKNLLNVVRATASSKFPILVQGPTSAGKTSMINYLASITGHKFVRINNHEHTDLQEYLGTYVSDSSGKLVFREGVLVEALRKGHWIVLDELNLAPTDVLEALNRLLDDNRELMIPETQEVVHPHPDFMLFATQNPPGLYGGRKVLSRAFRNRFLELHFDDIPQDELETILKDRCQIAPSYGNKIVEVYKQLSVRRQSTRLFEQKNSFATLRDLFRWALRDAVGYEELAANGYMLLAERVRSSEEKAVVKETIEKVMRVKLDMDAYYEKLENRAIMNLDLSIVWTKAMRRLAVLVERSITYKEPLLLVGETGCGKTTICQILAQFLGRQLIVVNAHQSTETGDILGAQRPLRNRFEARAELLKSLLKIFEDANIPTSLESSKIDDLVKRFEKEKSKLVEMSGSKITEERIHDVEEKIRASSVLFEWADGPLVQAMKNGDFFLLDEISLADDSVLERLNSILEPERSLLLAEKGTDDAFLTAAESFTFLATMNPGGDYGKKELSPALRNRFTEIWVPLMDDFNDVEQIVLSRLAPALTHLSKPLVAYSEWIGKKLGHGNANSGVISLRDILAWVEFVNSCGVNTDAKIALLNGAMMVFIDALGTNNTAHLAESSEKLQASKQECIDMLCSMLELPQLAKELQSAPRIELTQESLSAGIFLIPRVPGANSGGLFMLEAPTTSANAMRVIRAMQVNKPILLEGSPGVGKTSLVSAIAGATGNPLVRINLSEQTDLIDLFGSDAPVEGGATGEFEWRDAPFLRAMKNGEWVLLDEMNLASQSVLEGLNACLDHRGEAYIPELDRSFPRHPEFRVFAAQNPQYQGGGRKGLPKSFVNRFSVVYMDILNKDDLVLISKQIFPDIPEVDCHRTIQFMSRLEEDVLVKKLWGLLGGPWEFNLRDTLRWLSLFSSRYNFSVPSQRNIGDFLDMIICQRFRSSEDRRNVLELFHSIFGSKPRYDQYFALGETYFQSGGSLMTRNKVLQFSNSSDRIKFLSLQSNFSILESTMRAVNENIPVILTGPTNAGKTELIRYFANLTGVKLVEFSMNSDVDSMDILGGYEQVDLTRTINEVTTELTQVLEELLVVNLGSSLTEAISIQRCTELLHTMRASEINTERFHVLYTMFGDFIKLHSNEKLERLYEIAGNLSIKLREASTVTFSWFDGLLVQAVSRGDWLVLDNANLCNPSVLDRLNSLLETGGSLIINECSQADGSPRVLAPHPNFRLFLTVDPKYGELSRAMRNRCVEIFMDDLKVRATSFDRQRLGYSDAEKADDGVQNGDKSIDLMVQDLHIVETQSTTKPVSTFVSSTDSFLSNVSVVHDILGSNTNENLASVLAAVIMPRHYTSMTSWRKSLVLSEFGHDEVHAFEDLFTLLEFLHGADVLSSFQNIYKSEAVSNSTLPDDFSKSQFLHPYLNQHVSGLLGLSPNDAKVNAVTFMLQTAAGVLEAKKVLRVLEKKANSSKVSDLTFVEKSAAFSLGRSIKKPPKINIYGYLKAVATFVEKVFMSAVKLSDLLENTFEPLVELQVTWQSFITLAKVQDVSKLRVYHGMVSTWFETHKELKSVEEHASDVKNLSVGLELTSGFSMTRIWEHFRQTYPKSEEAWENYLNFLALLEEFDTLSQKVYPDTYKEVSGLRELMLSLYDELLAGLVKGEQWETIYSELSAAVQKLAALAETFLIERHNEFTREFTMLANTLKVSSYFRATEFQQEMLIANYTLQPTLGLILSSKRQMFMPYPRIFDSLWKDDDQVQALVTNKLISSALCKTTAMNRWPGKFLEQSLADMAALGGNLIENSPSLLDHHQAYLGKILFEWIVQILKAHDLEIPESISLDTGITESITQQLVTSVQSDASSGPALMEHIAPALIVLTRANNMDQLGKAWILFASGCIQLFVPNSPLDPAIEDHVTHKVFSEHQAMCKALIESWKHVGEVMNGETDNIIARSIPEPKRVEEIKPSVFRTNESIDELFDEWNAFMESAVDTQHVTNLLEAAEKMGQGNNSQKVGVFHNNSANFMLHLNDKFKIYADLNEILCGYIYGIRLGLDLMHVNHKMELASLEIKSMWQLEIENLMNPASIQQTFVSVRHMNKELGTSSSLSERLMLYFVNLCFNQMCSNQLDAFDMVVNQAFQSLYYRWYYRKLKDEEQAANEATLYKHKDTDNADEDFKEMFPDYDEVFDLASEPERKSESFDEVNYAIAKSYVDFYLHEKAPPLNALVFEGAQLCSEVDAKFPDIAPGTLSSSHLSALLIHFKEAHQKFSAGEDQESNFYHEPKPAEYKKAMNVVLSVYISVSKLLAQWPEHATLQNVSRVAQEFMEYPSEFPLNKLLHKIEVLHGFLNEWEKFASSQVTLKHHYEELTTLIVSWRKLELRSWKSLFSYEHLTFEKKLGKWWFHLFESIVVPFIQTNDDDDEETEKPSAVQLLAAMNIFMSEASYGEFEPRLNLVKAFRRHITSMAGMDSDIANGLGNFIKFYEQFVAHINATIKDTKKKLEKEVSEVILLASWKDVNIDALKQSSRKSHNNLYKVVRKYRNLLATPVAPLIEGGISKEAMVPAFDARLNKAPILVENSVEKRLALLKLCESVTTWSSRAKRLQNSELLERNLKFYIEKIEKAKAPSFYDFAKSVIEEAERLKKETPQVMNDDTKKTVAALRTQKHKLMSDTFKELRRIGVKTATKANIGKALATVNLILCQGAHLDAKTVGNIDGYYLGILDVLPRLRSAISSGNDEIPQPDLLRGLAASENLVFSLVTTRKPIMDLTASASLLSQVIRDLAFIANGPDQVIAKASIVDSLKSNFTSLQVVLAGLTKVLSYALEIAEAASYMGKPVDTGLFSELRSKAQDLSNTIPPQDEFALSSESGRIVDKARDFFSDLMSLLDAWVTKNNQTAFIADVVRRFIATSNPSPFVNSSTSLRQLAVVEDVEQQLRTVSNIVILSVQKVLELHSEDLSEEPDNWFSDSQQRLMKTIQLTHHQRMVLSLTAARDVIYKIEHNSESSLVTSALISFTMPLLLQYQELVESTVARARTNYVDVSKSTFYLMRMLHTVASEGFCSPEPPSEQKLNDNLQDGTGLGDGEGATNNSKDEEEDDDLAEHAQQPNEDKEKDDNEDDNDDAVDMEGDMAGDLEEVSDQDKDDEDEDDAEDEDLDEEVDDIDDLDPNAIDEKMWDEEAKDDEKEKESDKMPEKSQNDDDDMQANEDENDAKPNDDNKDSNAPEDEPENDEEADEEDDVGEQEDEVKNQENEQLDDHVPETDTLDLPEDMNLDDEEEDDKDEDEEENEEYDDQMDVDEDEATEDKLDDKANAEPADGEADEEQNDEDMSHDDQEADESDDEGQDEEEAPQVDGSDGEVEQDMSDEELAPEQQEEQDPEEKNDESANGEEAIEGEEGADNNNEDVEMDLATKTNAGEQGEGADAEAAQEQDDVGASGTANSELKQEEDASQDNNDDGARSEIKELLKQLGDAMKEFHRRRHEIKEAEIDESEDTKDKANVKPDEFQHVEGDNAEHDTQALGTADKEEQMQHINDDMAIDDDEPEQQEQPEEPAKVKTEEDMDEVAEESATQKPDDSEGVTQGGVIGERRRDEEENGKIFSEQELDIEVEEAMELNPDEDYTINPHDIPAMSLDEAREMWRLSEVATQELALGLSEQLRLILEPTLATKLRGDYKTGKRLNMKRIISYIASDFRKDKIWLRRTKPAKRQYQIMIAVDDSKSMTESKSTELAFHSIALVSKALTQLESGGLSIVRFGEDVKLVHLFDKPFNQETGANVFRWFDFKQERTDIKQLCRKSLKIFENARSTSHSDLWQLQIIISDGVCEDHETVQRLVRKAREEKVMLVFVVVDGITSSESIMDMSQVSYVPDPVTGAMSLKVLNYLDTFPFEFYVVVRNINELPEMLSLILRQYFSEVSNV